MNKPEHIPLNSDQEEALCELYNAVGFNAGAGTILNFLEQKLGKVHAVTIEVRKMLYDAEGEGRKLHEKAGKMFDESKIMDVLRERIELEDQHQHQHYLKSKS